MTNPPTPSPAPASGAKWRCNAERAPRNNEDISAFCDLPKGHGGPRHRQMGPWDECWPAASTPESPREAGRETTEPAWTFAEYEALSAPTPKDSLPCAVCGQPRDNHVYDSSGGFHKWTAAAPTTEGPREGTPCSLCGRPMERITSDTIAGVVLCWNCPGSPAASRPGAPEGLRQAARAMLDKYVGLVNSGDAGFWNPEEEPEVIALRAAIAASPAGSPTTKTERA